MYALQKKTVLFKTNTNSRLFLSLRLPPILSAICLLYYIKHIQPVCTILTATSFRKLSVSSRYFPVANIPLQLHLLDSLHFLICFHMVDLLLRSQIALRRLYKQLHLMLSTALGGRCYHYLDFIDEKRET